jgi:hypothetical protein
VGAALSRNAFADNDTLGRKQVLETRRGDQLNAVKLPGGSATASGDLFGMATRQTGRFGDCPPPSLNSAWVMDFTVMTARH